MDADLRARLMRLLEQAQAEERERGLLPCAPHPGDDEAAAGSCEAVAAHESCPYVRDTALCSRARLMATRDAVRARLAEGSVPEREKDLILAAVDRKAPLRSTDALQAIRARVAGKPWGLGTLRGNEALIALLGPRGVGKTLAGCYAIGRLGGRYMLSYQLARPGIVIEELVSLPVVVIDQIGREAPNSEWFAAQLEELLDRRYANRRLTIAIGNMSREQFCGAYDRIIEDRMRGDGAFVELKGSSLRVGWDPH